MNPFIPGQLEASLKINALLQDHQREMARARAEAGRKTTDEIIEPIVARHQALLQRVREHRIDRCVREAMVHFNIYRLPAQDIAHWLDYSLADALFIHDVRFRFRRYARENTA